MLTVGATLPALLIIADGENPESLGEPESPGLTTAN